MFLEERCAINLSLNFWSISTMFQSRAEHRMNTTDRDININTGTHNFEYPKN